MRTRDVKLCDCRGCGRVLLGESMLPWLAELPAWCEGLWVPAARLDGVPYCGRCLPEVLHDCCPGRCVGVGDG
jgi:hypothetical protein